MPHSTPSKFRLQASLPRQSPLFSAVFTPSGNHLALAGADRRITVWNPYNSLHLTTLTAHAHQVLCTSFDTSASLLVSCGPDHPLFLWDLHTSTLLAKLRGHTHTVNHVHFTSTSHPLILSASYDASVNVWDPRATKPLVQTLPRFGDSVTCVLSSAQHIFATSVDHTLRTFDIRAAKVAIDTLNAPVCSLALSRDAHRLLAPCLDSSLLLLEHHSGCVLCEYSGHVNANYSLDCAFLADDSAVICGSEDGQLCMWQAGGGGLPLATAQMGAVVAALDSHPTENIAVAATHDGYVSLWAVE